MSEADIEAENAAAEKIFSEFMNFLLTADYVRHNRNQTIAELKDLACDNGVEGVKNTSAALRGIRTDKPDPALTRKAKLKRTQEPHCQKG